MVEEEVEEEKVKLLHAVTNLLPLGPLPAPSWEDRCHASRQSIQLMVGKRTRLHLPHAAEVRFHVHKTDADILIPEMVGSTGV